MSEINPEELHDFCDKLMAFKQTLTASQQELLDAICKTAWEIGKNGQSLDSGFDGCFEPDEARVILSYRGGGHDFVSGIIKGAAFRSIIK